MDIHAVLDADKKIWFNKTHKKVIHEILKQLKLNFVFYSFSIDSLGIKLLKDCLSWILKVYQTLISRKSQTFNFIC